MNPEQAVVTPKQAVAQLGKLCKRVDGVAIFPSRFF